MKNLVLQWRKRADGIMPDSLDYSVSRGVWSRCADELEAALKLAEGQKPSTNSAMQPCQAANCSGIAEVHLCRECFDSINGVVRLPRQQ